MYSRYAAQKNPKDFTAEDESIIWEYASNHIAMFLTWVIDNGFYGNIHYEASDDIQLVKARKMTGTEFLAKHCDYRLSDEDFSPEILPLWNAITFKNIFSNMTSCSVRKRWLSYTLLRFLGRTTI